MRDISASEITKAVARLCIQANTYLSPGLRTAMELARQVETESLPITVLDTLLQNADIAERENIPICQDTGMAVVFMELGQEVHVTGGLIEDAVNEGVRRGYSEGYLRKSVVRDPVERVNTGDNTPAVIHYELVAGDSVRITVAPKGFGSENMSSLAMLTPSDGMQGLEDFVVKTAERAGANPCPPIVVGVGAGGTMEKAALLAKKALLRTLGSRHPDTLWAETEERLLKRINGLNIGPAGFGGETTALGVMIETYSTHIAGLPVAVNIGCHATRHQTAVL